jgi:hypothetical protein
LNATSLFSSRGCEEKARKMPSPLLEGALWWA